MTQLKDPALDPDFVAVQTALAGEYSLEGELGRGGMGIVYLAREVRLDRLVALKVLPPALAQRSDLRERFLREARTAAKLSQPNIVPIFRVDEIGGFVFFAMAYVEGETLTERVRRTGPMSPREVVPIVRDVAWALAYAHARGIVHRDVKPDNILLEQGTNRAMVTDFGIAHVTQASALTQDGMVMGTAHYMSPEQAAGEKLDGRSDLYSLGVVAYFALTGRLPFDAPTMQALLAMHLTQPPPPIGALRGGLPRGLTGAVERCLAKDPAQRFQSGEQLAEALAQSTEVARDIPAPLRVWARQGVWFRGIAITWYIFWALDMIDGPGTGHIIGFLLPIVLYLLFASAHTRRILEAGYSLDDIRLALRSHTEQREEESAFEVSRPAPLAARVIRDLTYVALASAAAAVVTIKMLSPESELLMTAAAWFGISVGSALSGAAIGLVFPGRRLDGRNALDRLRMKLWSGRFGEWMTKLSAIGLRHRAAATDAAHRPTELAIGSAADALFESLPKPVKRELHELPEVMRKLEHDAQAMRRRIDQLSQSIADVNAGTSSTLGTGAMAAQKGDLVADLERARTEASQRLQSTVAALERIRLGLLRLRAGAGSPADVTATLAAARRVADDLHYLERGTEVAGRLATAERGTPV